jgi:hypothetical protein
MATLTQLERLAKRIEAAGYDGLCNIDGDCGCPVDDLAPCVDSNPFHCKWAYIKPCSPNDDCSEYCNGYPDDIGDCYTTKKPKGR